MESVQMSYPEKTNAGLYSSDQNIVYFTSETKIVEDVALKKKKQSSLRAVWMTLSVVLSLLALTMLFVLIWKYTVFWVKLADAVNNNTVPEVKTQQLKDSMQTPYSFEDLFNTTFRPRYVSYGWVAGEDSVTYRASNGDLVKYDIDTGDTVVIVDGDTMASLGAGSYSFSPDGRYLLLPYDAISEVQDIMGVSRYKVYDIEQDEEVDFPNNEDMKGKYLESCAWSGSSNEMTLVWGGNLYYLGGPSEEPIAMTSNGLVNKIKNGMRFGFHGVQSGAAHTFNPNRQYLAYMEYDMSSIKTFEFPWYGDYDNLFGETYRMMFGKGGDFAHFGISKLFIIDMTEEDYPRVQMMPPQEFADVDHYVMRMVWRESNHLAITWLNREQTYAIVEICNVETMECVRNMEEEVTDGWIERAAWVLQFIDGGDTYIDIKNRDQGEEGPYRHLALVTSDLDGPGEVTFLTDGLKEVMTFVKYDSDRHLIYYIGPDDVPYGRQLFRVGTPAAEPEYQQVECVSCSVAPDCGWVSVSFSSSARYFVLTCGGPDVPYQVFQEVDGETRVVLEDNALVHQALSERIMPTREFRLMDIGGGQQGWGEMVLPPGFVDDGSVQYPVILYPYSGPGSNQASLEFKINNRPRTSWEMYFASSENVITVRLDGRGSAGRGTRFAQEMYKGLGQKEIEDQLLGAQFMKDNYPFVDPDKFAIWGWSYGGFVSSHALGNDSNILNCGIAVAPVTDYRYYYTGYTERYMSLNTPEDNERGYNLSSVIRKVENFRGKKFFLTHGSADDNVHFQHAAQLVKALTTADVEFDFMMYPDENHLIIADGPIKHMTRAMTNFIMDDCWGLGRPV